jgi:hypothetical protein
MCRSIKTLRPPYTEDVSEQDMRAAALQYVRKISGFRAPAPHNAEAFQNAVDAVSAATETLLHELTVRSPARPRATTRPAPGTTTGDARTGRARAGTDAAR